MIKTGTKVKWEMNGTTCAGTVVDIGPNDVALVEVMKMGNWHCHCTLDELTEITEQEENEFYGLKPNEVSAWRARK